MLLVAQFPISDARSFAPAEVSRLDLPDWPTPQTEIHPQFVRCFGPAVRRHRGPDAAWIDERAFCKADRAIRFENLTSARLGTSNPSRRGLLLRRPVSEFIPTAAFRRLLSDGAAVTRVEVGLTHSRRAPRLRSLGSTELFGVVRDLLHMPTTVAQFSGDPISGPLMLQGPRLGRLYERATTRLGSSEEAAAVLVESGVPLIVAELDEQELPKLPNWVRVVDPRKVGGAHLGFAWVKTEKGTIRTWLLSRGSASTSQLRSLRICLLRLHAEREALDLVLKQVRRGRLRVEPEDDSGEALQAYLNRATRLIQRDQFLGVSQSAIVAAFDAADDVWGLEDRLELSANLEEARNQVRRKIEAYARQRGQVRVVRTVTVLEGGTYVEGSDQIITGGTFTGPVINRVAAQTIENSFNTVANSGASAELKAALTTLHDEFAALARELEEKGEQPGTVEDGARLLDTFTKEATAERPLGTVLVAAGKGLVDAAKAVSERVTPIAGAVSAVLKLVGVAAIL